MIDRRVNLEQRKRFDAVTREFLEPLINCEPVTPDESAQVAELLEQFRAAREDSI